MVADNVTRGYIGKPTYNIVADLLDKLKKRWGWNTRYIEVVVEAPFISFVGQGKKIHDEERDANISNVMM